MSFDLLAPHYRWMEWLLAGEKLQRCRTAFLPKVTEATDVLILGEGNGRFLEACRRALPRARITCVDSSARMSSIAKIRLKRKGMDGGGIQFITADALAWSPPKKSFDLIVTHFFLDCFRPDELQRLIAVLAEGARPDATWLIADFQMPANGWKRRRAEAIHRLMYLFFRVATRLSARRLTSPDEFLRAQRFALQERHVSNWGLLKTDWWTRRNNAA